MGAVQVRVRAAERKEKQMKNMTAEDFKLATGRMPEDDDLERVNCPKVRVPGHMSCGWNWSWNAPVFEVGSGVKPKEV